MEHVRYLGKITLSILTFFLHWLESHLGDVALLVLVLEVISLTIMIISYDSWERFLILFGNLLDTYLHRELTSDVLMYEFKFFYEWVVNYFVTILAKTTALYLITLCLFDTSIFLLAILQASGSKISLLNYSDLDEYLKVMSHSDVERIVVLSPAAISWNILLATYETLISGILMFAADYLSATTPLPRPIDVPKLYADLGIIVIPIVYYVAWRASKPLRSWQLSRKSDRETMERLLGGDFGQYSGLQVVTKLLNSWVFSQILRVLVILGLFLVVYRFDGIVLTELAAWGLDCIFETIFFSWGSFFWSVSHIGIVALYPDKRALMRFTAGTFVCGAALVLVLTAYLDFWSSNQNHELQFKFQTETVIDLIKWFTSLVVFYFTTEEIIDYNRHNKMLDALAELEKEVQESRRLNRWGTTSDTSFSRGRESSTPKPSSNSPS